MGSLTVTITDVNGLTQTFAGVDEGVSLMEVAKAHGVEGIFGDCGVLDMVSDVQRDNSRLSCQLKMASDLDGIEVTVAPASAY